MTTRTRPGTVSTVLILLILVAVYQLIGSLAALTGAAAMETVDAVAESASVPTWAVLTAAGIGLAYGTAAVVLAVMVHWNRPGTRKAVTAVNTAYAVVILALLATPISGIPEIVMAGIALIVAGMANSTRAKEFFSTALPVGRAHPQAG